MPAAHHGDARTFDWLSTILSNLSHKGAYEQRIGVHGKLWGLHGELWGLQRPGGQACADTQIPVNKKARPPRCGGMPAYAPTAKEREIVEKAAGFGLPHYKICQLIVSERTGKPIDAKALVKMRSA